MVQHHQQQHQHPLEQQQQPHLQQQQQHHSSNTNSSSPSSTAGDSAPPSSSSGGGGKSTKPGFKSTKGASKMRRDMINGEIAVLRDLLPLPSSTRQRLSQLQLMALVCVYVRKSNYFDHVFKSSGLKQHFSDLPTFFGFSKALNGFIMMATQTGKLLYISDNAAEYLGHSMEDLLIHGDSVYDIIDKQDHASIQAQLMQQQTESSAAAAEANSRTSNGYSSSSSSAAPSTEKKVFLCRMNVSRNSRRQMRFGDQKVVLIEGRYSGVLPLCSRSEPVFVSWCTPVAMPETRESVVQGATNIYTSTHEMDLRFISVDENGQHYLGYDRKSLKGTSLYNILHPDSLKELQSKHRLITQSENEKSCILLIRLQRRDGTCLWCHCVIQVKDSSDQSSSSYIVCTNQILSPKEAEVMRANSWLYHYYMVQSRLQYNLAYGQVHPHQGQAGSAGSAAAAAGLAAIYPQMMHMISPFGFDSAHHPGMHFDHFNGDLYHDGYNGGGLSPSAQYGSASADPAAVATGSHSPPPPAATNGPRSGSASPRAAAASYQEAPFCNGDEEYYQVGEGEYTDLSKKATTSKKRRDDDDHEDDNNNNNNNSTKEEDGSGTSGGGGGRRAKKRHS